LPLLHANMLDSRALIHNFDMLNSMYNNDCKKTITDLTDLSGLDG
jgi:hypothetical protein